MFHLKLLAPAYVQGALRDPADGVVTSTDADEVQRLTEAGLAEDVSADFVENPANEATGGDA